MNALASAVRDKNEDNMMLDEVELEEQFQKECDILMVSI